MIEDQCIKLQANGVFHWDVADKFGLFPILMLSFLQRIKKYLKVKLLILTAKWIFFFADLQWTCGYVNIFSGNVFQHNPTWLARDLDGHINLWCDHRFQR